MKVVWRREEVTVRDVYEALRETRPIAYTTVMTMMNILEGKGYLRKEKEDRAYRYRSVRPERAVIGSMVREFVGRVFDGASEDEQARRHELIRDLNAAYAELRVRRGR